MMRKLYFLVPGTGGKFACGGLWAELKAMRLAQQVCPAEVVTYRQREKETLFLDDVVRSPSLRTDAIFVVSWGFDVAKLVARLAPYPVVYHAHSAGYGFRLPSRIPIITVSRNTLGYWGQQAPQSLVYYLPNQISDEFCNVNGDRDIDVLVQTRKSSTYLLNELIPALQAQCRVCVVDSFVDDLPGLFNRAKVYLYDSAEYWALQGVSEGFGLQPMEALACGCHVFSSINGGLSDYLDPGFNCHKIAGYSTAYDVQRILQVMHLNTPVTLPEAFLAEYRADHILHRWRVILTELNGFFDHQATGATPIQELGRSRLWRLKVQQLWKKLRQRWR